MRITILLIVCHIILTKKRIADSCFERVCILCQCVGALIQSTCSLRMALKLINCLILCRRVGAKILADENREGQEVVLAVTVAYLVLSAVIVVQKESLAPTEKRPVQILQQILPDFLPVHLIDTKKQQQSPGTKLG